MLWCSLFLAQSEVQKGMASQSPRLCLPCSFSSRSWRQTQPLFIEFAIIKPLQFPVFCVWVCVPHRARQRWRLGTHLIEATVLIVFFSVSFSLLNNLSRRQLLNQPLSLLSSHKEAQAPSRPHTQMQHVHMEISLQSDSKKERAMCYQTPRKSRRVGDLAAVLMFFCSSVLGL